MTSQQASQAPLAMRKRARDPPELIAKIRERFVIDGANPDSLDAKATCEICGVALECTKTSNLKRHLALLHPVEMTRIHEEPVAPSRKMRKVVVEIDEQFYLQSCVKMTTAGGLPLNVFDVPGLVDVLSQLESGLRIGHVNRNNISGNYFFK